MKPLKKLSVLVCFLLTVVMIFTACSSGQSVDGDKTVVGDESKVTEGTGTDRDTLLFAIGNEPASLDPGEYNGDTSPTCILQCYDQLVREKIGDRSTIEPMLAESWEFEDEGKKIVFKIKQGVKFHDGSEMTVEDVAYSLNRSMALPSYSEYAPMLDNAEVIDDTHVVLNMKKPYAPIINLLAMAGFSIMSEDYAKQCEEDEVLIGRNPMGTGPYIFQEWKGGSALTYVANPNYWDGEPPIKNLEMRIMGDATTAAISLEAGDIDVFWGVDSADLPRLRTNDDLSVLSVQSSGFYYLGMNTAAAPFDDEKVRKAAQFCMDRQEIIDGGADGVGWETHCMITPGYFGYQDDFIDSEQDFEKSKKLLADAGYPDGIDVVMVTPEESWYARPAQVVQEQLRQGGFNVEMEIMERGSFNDKVGARDFEMTYYAVWPSIPDADDCVYQLFHKDYATTKGSANIGNIIDDEVTALVEEGRELVDPDERHAVYRKLTELNSERAYAVPILTSTNTICARKDVAGCYGHSGGLYRVADWSY